MNGKIRSQNRCPDQVHKIIYSENQAYTDPWKHQRWNQVPRRSKHPLLTGHTRRAPLVGFHSCNTMKASCEIVALQENFVYRPESYDSASAKNCIFLAHEKTRTIWGIFLHSHTQPAPKQGIKIFLRHFTTTLVPSLTLQLSDIVQSSLESPKL